MFIKKIFYRIKYTLSKYFFGTTKKVYFTGDKERKHKKIKVKHHIPFFKRLISGNEQLITAILVLSIFLGLWFLYMVFGTWDVAKFIAGIDQTEEIKLPGENPFDK
jgi:hypothetical protein